MVEYGPNVASPAYALGNASDFYCPEAGDEHTPFSYASNAFNGVLTSASCVSRKLDGYTGATPANGGLKIGQDFGVGNEKHIRKIRYQNIYNVSKVDIRTGNNSNSWYAGTLILNAQNVVQEDTGWNEIILPYSQSYRYWGFIMDTYGSNGSYVRCAVGEIEMMEAIRNIGSMTFFV